MEVNRCYFAKKAVFALLLCWLIAFQPGCLHKELLRGQQFLKSPPRIRPACYASSTVGTKFIAPEKLSKHGYSSGWSEGNGIVYTCRGGHIDVAHLRKTADWTAFLAKKTLKHIKKKDTEFKFKLKEPSVYYVHITYPSFWEDLPEDTREYTEREISLGLGQYFAYTASIWHEILTWFGYSAISIYPEFPSAFSWEDTYSNLLGTRIAVKALRDKLHPYDEAVTLTLEKELEYLEVQPKATAVHAAEQVEGLWFEGSFLFFVDMKRRNFDFGLDNGFVTPWIVPGLSECEDAKPKRYPVPSLDFLDRFHVSVSLEIQPKERVKKKILKVVYPDQSNRKKRINPAVHFPRIMEYIKQDAAQRYGYDVGLTPQ